MVTQISGLAPGSAGFKLTGQITKEDYDDIILPAVKRVTDSWPTLNLLLMIDTDLSNFTVGAWMKDALLGIKNLTKFNRVALVSNSDIVRTITAAANKLVPGEYRTFSLIEATEAIAWIAGMETAVRSARP